MEMSTWREYSLVLLPMSVNHIRIYKKKSNKGFIWDTGPMCRHPLTTWYECLLSQKKLLRPSLILRTCELITGSENLGLLKKFSN